MWKRLENGRLGKVSSDEFFASIVTKPKRVRKKRKLTDLGTTFSQVMKYGDVTFHVCDFLLPKDILRLYQCEHKLHTLITNSPQIWSYGNFLQFKECGLSRPVGQQLCFWKHLITVKASLTNLTISIGAEEMELLYLLVQHCDFSNIKTFQFWIPKQVRRIISGWGYNRSLLIGDASLKTVVTKAFPSVPFCQNLGGQCHISNKNLIYEKMQSVQKLLLPASFVNFQELSGFRFLTELQINSTLIPDTDEDQSFNTATIASGISQLLYLKKFTWNVVLNGDNRCYESNLHRRIQSNSLEILKLQFTKCMTITSIDCPNLRHFIYPKSWDYPIVTIPYNYILSFRQFISIKLPSGEVVPKSETNIEKDALYVHYDHDAGIVTKLILPENCKATHD